MVEVVPEYPQDINPKNIFPPATMEDGYLVFRSLEESPSSVDIVSIYRPEAEHEDIILKHALPLRAKALWLQSMKSETTRQLADRHHLLFFEGMDIADVAKNLYSAG